MKYLEEFRDPESAQRLFDDIRRVITRPWTIMEVCGGQTHSIIRNGIDQLLPAEVELIHGPGCPVCVTPLEIIDKALAIAAQPGVIFCSFGDMLRVPGSTTDLFGVKSAGGDVRIVYSPLDALQLARDNPERPVVFFGIGFETTAPANAMAVVQAKRLGVDNFSMLVSHVLVPPAIEAILTSPSNRVQAFLAAGHVCSVMGTWQYRAAGGALPHAHCRHRLRAAGRARGHPPRGLSVGSGRSAPGERLRRAPSPTRATCPRRSCWPRSSRSPTAPGAASAPSRRAAGACAPPIAQHDAETHFDVADIHTEESPLCHSGEVLQGLLKPNQCPAFGKQCTPQTPLGATMVSSEGACAAYYRYGRAAITPVETAIA